MGKSNKNKNRKRQTESGASETESEMPHVPAPRQLPVMQERKGSKVVTMAQHSDVEMPEMRTGSKESSSGFTPMIKSFFKPLITPRNKRPKFLSPTSGVPAGIKKSWGYWRPQNKTATKSGTAITLWYYYELGDGPFADSIFGDPIGDAFWVHRENAEPRPPNSAYDNAYSDDKVRGVVSSKVRIDNNYQQLAGYSSAGESSAWDTDAGSVHSASTRTSSASERKKKLKKTKSQRDSETARTSDEDGARKQQPARTEYQRERSLAKMRNMPVFLRSLTADSVPADVYGESLPPGRLDAYLETKDWFPSRHFFMHYADVHGKYDPAADNIKVMFGLCLDIDPDYPQSQHMVKWLVKNHLIADESDPDFADSFDEKLRAGAYKASTWQALAAGDRTSREAELERQRDELRAELTSVKASVADLVRNAVETQLANVLAAYGIGKTTQPTVLGLPQNVPLQLSVAVPAQPCMSSVPVPQSAPLSQPAAAVITPAPISDWSEHVEATQSAAASAPLERRIPRTSTYAEKATASLIPPSGSTNMPNVIFTKSDGSLPSTESSDLRVSTMQQEEL